MLASIRTDVFGIVKRPDSDGSDLFCSFLHLLLYAVGQKRNQTGTAECGEETEVGNHVQESCLIEKNHRDALKKVDDQRVLSHETQDPALRCVKQGAAEEKTAGGDHIQLMEKKGTGMKAVAKRDGSDRSGQQSSPGKGARGAFALQECPKDGTQDTKGKKENCIVPVFIESGLREDCDICRAQNAVQKKEQEQRDSGRTQNIGNGTDHKEKVTQDHGEDEPWRVAKIDHGNKREKNGGEVIFASAEELYGQHEQNRNRADRPEHEAFSEDAEEIGFSMRSKLKRHAISCGKEEENNDRLSHAGANQQIGVVFRNGGDITGIVGKENQQHAKSFPREKPIMRKCLGNVSAGNVGRNEEQEQDKKKEKCQENPSRWIDR